MKERISASNINEAKKWFGKLVEVETPGGAVVQGKLLDIAFGDDICDEYDFAIIEKIFKDKKMKEGFAISKISLATKADQYKRN